MDFELTFARRTLLAMLVVVIWILGDMFKKTDLADFQKTRVSVVLIKLKQIHV